MQRRCILFAATGLTLVVNARGQDVQLQHSVSNERDAFLKQLESDWRMVGGEAPILPDRTPKPVDMR